MGSPVAHAARTVAQVCCGAALGNGRDRARITRRHTSKGAPSGRLLHVNEREHEAGLVPTPGYRYADAVGDRLYVAGQVPLDRAGRLVLDDPAAQARQCLENLVTLVEVHGFGRADIRHLTVYAAVTREQLAEVWAAVLDAFDGDAPPSTLVGVAALGHDGQTVEVDARVERAG